MSGLGKTHMSNLLRGTGSWFHYSIDYRIGTRYMGEFIAIIFMMIYIAMKAYDNLLILRTGEHR